MKNISGVWSDERPYYMIYQDKMALKNIYAQLNIDFPDVGEVSYIGANTHRQAKDYSLSGEQGCFKERKHDTGKGNQLMFRKNDNRGKAGLVITDVKETIVTENFYQPIPLSILKNYMPKGMY